MEDAQAPEHAAAGHATVPEQRSLIELAGVARRYDMGEVTVTALEDVDLRIERGEFVVVLGGSERVWSIDQRAPGLREHGE